MLLRRPSSTDRSDERGVALIGVLLLLMMMSALAAALTVNGHTETLVTRNHQSLAQARAAAEAGLNHATQATLAWLAQWPNTFATADLAVDALLLNPGLVTTVDFTQTYDTLGANLEYEVDLFDDDDPARPGGPADASDVDENGIATDDSNRTLVIRATGRGPNNTAVALEAIIAPYSLPAIITGDDLTISGNPTINANANGGVHSNADLSITGNPVIVGVPVANGTATATGTYSHSGVPVITGATGGGVPAKDIPSVRASFYLSWADFILHDNGQMTTGAGALLCDASSNQNACRNDYGWKFSSGQWELETAAANGTVYVETGVKISGSPGSVLDPVDLTLIAEGSIEISGSPYLTPADSELLFVTDGDLKIGGNLEIKLAEGQMLVREQLHISGNPILLGQIVVENAANDDSLVTENRISGNPVITYNGDVGNSIFSVFGWREIR